MTRESLECRARELAAELPLTAQDWEAVLDQAQRVLDAVATLDELPLDAVEPPAVYRVAP
jgi:hypothetical protein